MSTLKQLDQHATRSGGPPAPNAGGPSMMAILMRSLRHGDLDVRESIINGGYRQSRPNGASQHFRRVLISRCQYTLWSQLDHTITAALIVPASAFMPVTLRYTVRSPTEWMQSCVPTWTGAFPSGCVNTHSLQAAPHRHARVRPDGYVVRRSSNDRWRRRVETDRVVVPLRCRRIDIEVDPIISAELDRAAEHDADRSST